MRDVVITGVGLQTPMGSSLESVRAIFQSGRPVIQAFEGPGGGMRIGARLAGPPVNTGFSRGEQATLDPAAMMAQTAAAELIADAAMQFDQLDRDRIGVYLGTGQGSRTSVYDAFTSLVLNDKLAPFSVIRSLDNGAANNIAIKHGLRGSCETTVLACSSSNAAMGSALRAIRHGYLDAAITGGVESTFQEGAMRAWEALRVQARIDPVDPATSCRPFAADRSGLVLGEGAVLYMFEAEEHARARGARIYARVAGYGASSDATHLTAPDASGQALSLNACLRDAGLSIGEIGYINAYGAATVAGDAVEVRALRQVLGSRAGQVPISATKSLHGHLLGASGAVELLAAIFALREGLIAPTANLHQSDPAFELDFVPLHARTGVDVGAALSSSFAFGGSNACIALTRA